MFRVNECTIKILGFYIILTENSTSGPGTGTGLGAPARKGYAVRPRAPSPRRPEAGQQIHSGPGLRVGLKCFGAASRPASPTCTFGGSGAPAAQTCFRDIIGIGRGAATLFDKIYEKGSPPPPHVCAAGAPLPPQCTCRAGRPQGGPKTF